MVSDRSRKQFMEIGGRIVEKQSVQFLSSLPVKNRISMTLVIQNVNEPESQTCKNLEIEMIVEVFELRIGFIVLVNKQRTDRKDGQPTEEGNNIQDSKEFKQHTYWW